MERYNNDFCDKHDQGRHRSRWHRIKIGLFATRWSLKMADRISRRFVQICEILLPLLLVSCMRERPTDLKLEQIYVVDISGSSLFKAQSAQGRHPSPLHLAIELSTAETFPLGAHLAWGFCGEKKEPEWLYTVADTDDPPNHRSSAQNDPVRHRYIALPWIVFDFHPPIHDLPNYDLTKDNRDICLGTGSGTYADVWKSNEVRVPRSLIEKALHEPPHTSLPLSRNS